MECWECRSFSLLNTFSVPVTSCLSSYRLQSCGRHKYCIWRHSVSLPVLLLNETRSTKDNWEWYWGCSWSPAHLSELQRQDSQHWLVQRKTAQNSDSCMPTVHQTHAGRFLYILSGSEVGISNPNLIFIMTNGRNSLWSLTCGSCILKAHAWWDYYIMLTIQIRLIRGWQHR